MSKACLRHSLPLTGRIESPQKVHSLYGCLCFIQVVEITNYTESKLKSIKQVRWTREPCSYSWTDNWRAWLPCASKGRQISIIGDSCRSGSPWDDGGGVGSIWAVINISGAVKRKAILPQVHPGSSCLTAISCWSEDVPCSPVSGSLRSKDGWGG